MNMNMNMNPCDTRMPSGRPMFGQQPPRMPGAGQQQQMQGTGQRPQMQGACQPPRMQSRDALMRQINEASFALDDILLFLDTHPTDAAAMQYYRNVAAMRRNAMDAYQNQFGPLMVDDVNGNTWDWVTEKWPWEGGC